MFIIFWVVVFCFMDMYFELYFVETCVLWICVLLLVDMSYLYEHMILSFMAVLFSLSMAYVIGYFMSIIILYFFMYAWMVGM